MPNIFNRASWNLCYFNVDLYHRLGDQKKEAEAFQMHSGFTKKLLNSKLSQDLEQDKSSLANVGCDKGMGEEMG